MGNRLTRERLDFVYHIAFPASHAELLPVRESKKERSAYEAQLKEEGAGGESRELDAQMDDDPGRCAWPDRMS